MRLPYFWYCGTDTLTGWLSQICWGAAGDIVLGCQGNGDVSVLELKMVGAVTLTHPPRVSSEAFLGV